jgi:hypothetical protein
MMTYLPVDVAIQVNLILINHVVVIVKLDPVSLLL